VRKRFLSWLDREFVELSAEAQPAASAADEASLLFQRFDDELTGDGLSLNGTVRTRLWARDRQSRDLASIERRRILSGEARSASSSYIAPGHFDSDGRVAVDLLAMISPKADARKHLVEYDPPIVPIRFLVYDSVVVLSGVTSVQPTLEGQLDNILPRIEGSLTEAGTTWASVARISFYLHRSRAIKELQTLFDARIQASIPNREVVLVDGFSTEGKLCEIEVTGVVQAP